MTRLLSTLVLGALPLLASAQQAGWGQCGGTGWAGATTCVSGYVCVKNNDFYSQCIPGVATQPVTTTAAGTTTAPSGNDPTPPPSNGGPSGVGKTTRYWDCCKSSCAWTGKGAVSHPVNTCNAQNQILTDYSTTSGCDGGTAFMCNNQAPWGVSTNLAYGYAAVRINGLTEKDWCCACYELTFTSGPASGKRMIVQATNTGGDLGDNHFDIAMPGGGVGIFNGCTLQYNAPASGWGDRYGGVHSRAECDALPAALKPGCQWRFDWFGGSDNPGVNFRSVACPAALTANTGCVRSA